MTERSSAGAFGFSGEEKNCAKYQQGGQEIPDHHPLPVRHLRDEAPEAVFLFRGKVIGKDAEGIVVQACLEHRASRPFPDIGLPVLGIDRGIPVDRLQHLDSRIQLLGIAGWSGIEFKVVVVPRDFDCIAIHFAGRFIAVAGFSRYVGGRDKDRGEDDEQQWAIEFLFHEKMAWPYLECVQGRQLPA